MLEEAGYKEQPSVKSKASSFLPVEPLVKIVNLGVEQHTISIDINIKLELPSDLEIKRKEGK